jgi:membrane-associated protease RseP (regulator of RpoE activity)
MMPDHGFHRDPSTTSERVIYALFLLVILGLFAADVFTDFQPVKLSALLVVLFWIPLLALHEAGHAVVAKMLGWRVHQLVVGMGKPVAHFWAGEVSVEVRMLPVEGFVTTAPRNLHNPRIKSALIYFAGPGVELLLALVILLLLGPERLFSRSENYVLITWQSLALASTAGAVLNLIPHSVKNEEGRWIANDGLGIIQSFLVPIDHFAEMIDPRESEGVGEWQPDDPDWWKRR